MNEEIMVRDERRVKYKYEDNGWRTCTEMMSVLSLINLIN